MRQGCAEYILMEENSPVKKGPKSPEIRIAMEAADYRNYMVGVFLRRGLHKDEAWAKAAEATDAQLARRMQELEAQRARRGK